MRKIVSLIVLLLLLSVGANGENSDESQFADVVDIRNALAASNVFQVLTSDGNISEIQINEDRVTKVSVVGTNAVALVGNDMYIDTEGRLRWCEGWDRWGCHYKLDDDWHDIAQAAMESDFGIGLRNDGTLVSIGSYEDGERDIDGWTNIISIDVGMNCTFGLKEDGTVLATGANEYGQCNVSNWTGIIQICSGTTHTLGLKADGTVVATGSNKDKQCDVSEWSNVSYIGAGYDVSYGFTKDGRILTTKAAFRYDENYNCIPSDYSCEDAKKVIFRSRGIYVIDSNNRVEYFGPDKGGYTKLLLEMINGDIPYSVPDSHTKSSGYSESYCKSIATDYLKQYLKNPSSLQIHSVSSSEKGNEYVFVFDYSAMNSLGGYTRSTYICSVDSKTGKVTAAFSD